MYKRQGLHWDAGADLDQVAALIGLPGNVQALLTARIDQLSPDVRRTLQLASVIGRSFAFPVLERIAEKPGATVAEHLKRLAQADLVRPAGGGAADDYAFRHALTRDAAYETILLRQRRRYHRRVGEAMEVLYADRLTDEAPRLAYHFAECRDWPKAVRYHALAGEAAARLYANAEAIEHLSRAVDICRATPEAIDEAQVAELFRRRGRVFEVAGQHDEALRNYEELERLGRQRQSPVLELEGLMAQAPLYVTPTTYMDATHGRELADRILALAERTGRADATAFGHWVRLLLYLNVAPDGAQAVEEGERALALARQHGLAELEAYVLNDISRAYAAVGRPDDAFRTFEVAYERWQALGNEPMMADVLGIWAQGRLLRGDPVGAEPLARQSLAIGRRIGSPWAQAFNTYGLAFVLWEQGRVDEALPLFWATAEVAMQAGFPSLGANTAVLLRWLLHTLGRPDTDRDQLAAVLDAAGEVPHGEQLRRIWRGLDSYFAGDVAAAYEAVTQDFVVDYTRDGPHAVTVALIQPTIALAAGKPAEALAAIDRLLADMAQFGFTTQHGEIYRLRGDALRQLGRDDEARAAYTTALQVATAQGALRSIEPAQAALSLIRN